MSLDYSDIPDLLALPFDLKVELARNRIHEWHDAWDGQVYVSYSGGKDSCVLLHLVRDVYPDVPAVFFDTGLQYPEVKAKVREVDNVVIIRPKMSFRQVLQRYGYPVVSKEQAQFIHDYRTTKSQRLRHIRQHGNKSGFGKISDKWWFLTEAPFPISHKCCNVMKKEPARRYERETGRKPFLGMRIEESQLRKQKFIADGGCNAFDAKRKMSCPLSLWTEQDILTYIDENGIELPLVYGDLLYEAGQYVLTGIQQTGCIFCAFGVHREKYPNRFQRLERTHPKLYQYCMEGLRMREVLEYINVPHRYNQMMLWESGIDND